MGYTVENYVCVSVFLFFTFPSSVVFVFHYISIMHLPSSIIYDFLFKANKKESKKGALKNIVETTEQMKKKTT